MILRSKLPTVMFWADINPGRGSFEDFICFLAQGIKQSGMSIFFVLGRDISPGACRTFAKAGVEYYRSPDEPLNRLLLLRRVIALKRPSVGHFHFIGPGDPLILAAGILGLDKIVLTDHMSTLPLPDIPYGHFAVLRKIKQRFLKGRVDSIIAVSNFVKSQWISKPENRSIPIRTIYNGINLQRFRPPSNDIEKDSLKWKYFGIDNGTKVVSYVGQLRKEKGVLTLLDAIKHPAKVHDKVLYVFAGDGPLSAEIHRFANQCENTRVKFLGKREDAEVIMRASDILVAPSLWQEAFGLVAAEAAASGVPVIASKIGGLQEVVLHDKTGIVIEPGNPRALSDATVLLLSDPLLCRNLSAAARAHAEAHFDITNIVRETIEHYCDLLDLMPGKG